MYGEGGGLEKRKGWGKLGLILPKKGVGAKSISALQALRRGGGEINKKRSKVIAM